MTRIDRNMALEAIQNHLAAHGARRWSVLLKRFPGVSQSSFWRWVKLAKAQRGQAQLIACNEWAVSHLAERTGDDYGDGGAIERTHRGPNAYALSYRQLYADAMRLRSHALRPDGSVRYSLALDRSVRTRLKLLLQGVRLEREMLALAEPKRFFEAVLAEVAQESPDLQRRIADRLRWLQEDGLVQRPASRASAEP
jgi:hypothetical protein